MAGENQAFFRTFMIASASGIFSLFPLLFTPAGKLFLLISVATSNQEFYRNYRQGRLLSVMGYFDLRTSAEEGVRVSSTSYISRNSLIFLPRFPKSLPFVIIDTLEKAYIAGFAALQLFTTLFPIWASRSSVSADIRTNGTILESSKVPTGSGPASNLEFLPLMLTSIYCAIGLVWAFIRLSVLYLKQSESMVWT